MKELWARISYAWFVGILIFVGLFVPAKVFALTNWSTNYSRLVLDNAGTPENTSWTTSSSPYSPQLPVIGLQYRVRSSDGLSKDNTYKFTVAYKPTPDALYGYSITLLKSENELENANCSGFTRFSDGYYKSTCVFTPEYNYSSSDYLYIRIAFYSSYVNSLGIGITGYEYTKGVGTLVTEGANNIISNNNANTQLIIDSQKELFTNQCANLLNLQTQFSSKDGLTINNNNGTVHITGTTNNGGDYYYSPIGTLSSGTYYFNTDNTSNGVHFYIWDSTNLTAYAYDGGSFTLNNNSSVSVTLQTVNNKTVDSTFKLSLFKYTNQPFCVYGSSTNKLDETTDAVKDLNDTIEDDDVDDPDDMISDFEDLLPSNGVITSLLGLPLTLYGKVISNINGTCSQYNLGSLYGTNLIIPCIDMVNYLGSTLWNTIDIIISGLFVFVIGRKMIKVFNNFTSMKEGDVISND